MVTLEKIQNDIKLLKTFKGAGHYLVTVYYNSELLGEYIETDMEQIADISELNNGFEHELINNKTFEDVYETALFRLKRVGESNNNELLEDILETYF